MPIKNFRPAGERSTSELPEIGRLRKGEPMGQSRFPKEIDYFRFTSEEDALVHKFYQVYGAQPKEIDCLAAYDNPEDTFSTWNEEYSQTGLLRMCDGWNIAKNFNHQTKYIESYLPLEQAQRPQCEQLATGKCGCKPRGRLSLILPRLGRLGAVILTTGSKYDIGNLISSLNYLNELVYDKGGTLRNIPLRLMRVPKTVKTPHIGQSGHRTKQTFNFLKLEAHPNWVEKYAGKIFAVSDGISYTQIDQASQQHKALPAAPVLENPDPPYTPPADRPAAIEQDVYTVRQHAQEQNVFEFFETYGLTDPKLQSMLARLILKISIPTDWRLTFSETQINAVKTACMQISVQWPLAHYIRTVRDRMASGELSLDTFDLTTDLSTSQQPYSPQPQADMFPHHTA